MELGSSDVSARNLAYAMDKDVWKDFDCDLKYYDLGKNTCCIVYVTKLVIALGLINEFKR